MDTEVQHLRSLMQDQENLGLDKCGACEGTGYARLPGKPATFCASCASTGDIPVDRGTGKVRSDLVNRAVAYAAMRARERQAGPNPLEDLCCGLFTLSGGYEHAADCSGVLGRRADPVTARPGDPVTELEKVATSVPGGHARIWSNKHGGWWREMESGYTTVWEWAGVYPIERARQLVDKSNGNPPIQVTQDPMGRRPPIAVPNAVLVPVPPTHLVEAFRGEALKAHRQADQHGEDLVRARADSARGDAYMAAALDLSQATS